MKKLQEISKSGWFMPTVLLLLLIPTAFINRDSKLDWGDDNFQYLYQAKHLWSAEDACVLINPQDHGPEKKGLFFSFLLSFNLAQTITGYKTIVFLIFIFCAWSLFTFFRSRFQTLSALLLALCFAYHPFSIALKNEILSEFLFTGLLFLIIYLLYKKEQDYYLITFLFVLLTLTREIGAFYYLCFLIRTSFVQPDPFQKKATRLLFGFLLYAGLWFLSDLLLYRIHANGQHFYLNAFSLSDPLYNLKQNTSLYFNHALSYFEFESPQGFNDGLKALIIILIVLGATDLIRKKEPFTVLLFVGSVLILLCYPDQAGIRRFLLPLFPFLLFFIAQGMSFIFGLANKIKQADFASSLLFVAILSLEIKTTSLRNDEPALAANDPGVIQDLEQLRLLTDADAVIGFEKPYVINYFCERNSFALTGDHRQAIPPSVTHLLFLKNKDHPNYKNQISASQPRVTLSNFELVNINR